ncbi:MAG: hypothetical protein HC785_20860 [Calothrix sp. CSU_2_0]|nr:hypothetical protein [Calothrix sp. CSU_2_0]
MPRAYHTSPKTKTRSPSPNIPNKRDHTSPKPKRDRTPPKPTTIAIHKPTKSDRTFPTSHRRSY